MKMQAGLRTENCLPTCFIPLFYQYSSHQSAFILWFWAHFWKQTDTYCLCAEDWKQTDMYCLCAEDSTQIVHISLFFQKWVISHLVHDITDTIYWAQNGSTHSHVFLSTEPMMFLYFSCPLLNLTTAFLLLARSRFLRFGLFVHCFVLHHTDNHLKILWNKTTQQQQQQQKAFECWLLFK